MLRESLQKIDIWVGNGTLSEDAAANVRHWLTDAEYADFVQAIQDLIQNEDTDELENDHE